MAPTLKEGNLRDSSANRVSRHIWIPVLLDHDLVDRYMLAKRRDPKLTYSKFIVAIIEKGLK